MELLVEGFFSNKQKIFLREILKKATTSWGIFRVRKLQNKNIHQKGFAVKSMAATWSCPFIAAHSDGPVSV